MQADRPRQRPNRLPWSRWRHALGTLGRHQGTLLREVALPRAPVILRIREHPRHVVLLVMGTPSEQGPCTADALGSDAGETCLQRQAPCALGASRASWVRLLGADTQLSGDSQDRSGPPILGSPS